MTDVIIIGGGAAGMAAAVAVKLARPETDVVIYERQSRVGRKLLATGNGRCNITNAYCERPDAYNNAFASRVVSSAGLKRVIDMFKTMGLECVFDQAGRAYPESDQAASVVDALRLTLDEMGVNVETGNEITRVRRTSNGFEISSLTGVKAFSRRVIIACGGAAGEKLGGGKSGYALLKSLGHGITEIFPSLTQLRTETEDVKALKGIKRQCEIALEVNAREIKRETGEILFCDYGISGIAAMALSGEAALCLNKGLSVNVVIRVRDMSRAQLLSRAEAMPLRAMEDFLSGVMPKRLGQQMLKLCDIRPLSRPCGSLTPKEADNLSEKLSAWRIRVTGVNGFTDAQATKGGANVGEFYDSLESRLVSGMYAAGEVLDVDGPCGGFNLHWAWASGIVAGESCAKSLGGGC